MSGAMAWAEQPEREVVPGFHGRFIHSERMTFALWRIEAGALLPEHNHPHEQVLHLYSGEFELVLDGTPHHCMPGTVLAIPPGIRHSGRAITECAVMDVFAPVREDYRAGTGGATLLGGVK